MKIRVTGFVLAMVLLLSVAMPAFASNESRNIPQASSDREQSAPSVLAVTGGRTDSPFVLDGAAMYGLTYEVYMNTNYITVDSFVAAVDRNAVVEEEKGTVVVTSEATEAVVTVMVNGGFVIAAGAVSTANVEEESLRLTARKGEYYVEANGRVLYVEDGVILVDGKVALPVRVLAKIFNMDVAYDAESKKVTLTRQKEGGAYLEDGETYYDEDMLYWMSRIIYSESGNQPLRGKIAVGNVVLNRMADPSFPDTIYGVLFQKNQFSPAMSGSIYRTPNAASVKAAKMVLDGAEALENVLFFNRKGMNTRASRNRPFVATIGGHSFYA